MRRWLVGLLLGVFAVASAQEVEPPKQSRLDAEGKAILALDPGGHVGLIVELLITPDSKRLISVSQDRTIQVWGEERGRNSFLLDGKNAARYHSLPHGPRSSTCSWWLRLPCPEPRRGALAVV